MIQRSRANGIIVAAAAISFFGAASAGAVEFSLLDDAVGGSLDTTLSSGVLLRSGGQNKDVTGIVNGGRAESVNFDDGDLNYGDWDPASAPFKATHELQISWKNFQVFARAFYFYDPVIQSTGTDHIDLGDTAKRRAGARIQHLDAFGVGKFDVGSLPLTVRFGNQVISWGESTFIQNGINVINPVDVTQLRVPGAELRQALVPVPAVDMSLGLTDRLSIEAFYQFIEVSTELEPHGTYFSTDDVVSPGGRFLLLGFGEVPDSPVPPPGTGAPVGVAVPNGGDHTARNGEQWGVAIRYFEPMLWATEFGFYYEHYNSRLPLFSTQTGTLQGLLAGDYARSARYFREFPNDSELIGASFSNELGSTGIAVQGEVSWHIRQPLQLDDVEIVYATLTPLAAVSPLGAALQQNQVGSFGFDEYVRGYRRKDYLQPQMTLTKLLGPTLGADQLLLLAEMGGTLVMGLEDEDKLRYEGPGTYTSGNPFFTQAGIQPSTTTDGFADARSWGYRLVVRPTFLRALGAVNLEPTFAFQHDVQGTTPSPIISFISGRKAATVALKGIYLEKTSAEVGYTNFFGGDTFNLLNDRDFVSISLSYSF
jgi:uncharacterized protein DUF1302